MLLPMTNLRSPELSAREQKLRCLRHARVLVRGILARIETAIQPMEFR